MTRDAAAIAEATAALLDAVDRLTTHEANDDDAGMQTAADALARIAGGEYRPAYNGWPNRETWNAALWIDNDEATYNASRAIVREAIDDYETPALLAEIRAQQPEAERLADERRGAVRSAADALREWFDEAYRPGAPYEEQPAGPLTDAWTWTVAVIDWYRIADGIAEELPEPETGDEA